MYFWELQNLYNCTTPTVDEFTVCVQDYPSASTLMSSAPYVFNAGKDDLTFSSFTPTTGLNNIVQIDYAGTTLFQEKMLSTDSEIPLDSAITLGVTNDNLVTSQTATFQKPVPADAINDVVSIYYKVDGTCERLGTTLARCTKYYTQGQTSSPRRSSDHNSGNQVFGLPSYADTSFNVLVNVGGSPVAEGAQTWSLSGNNVVFSSTDFPIFDNQEIAITYFVSSNVLELTQSKQDAQAKIDDHCACDSQE